ncbi:MAG TPA: ATP-binding protein [Chitinophagales bacterium]|nr:ATP-binding protein [Chitinophagales bacterium]
MRRRSILTFYVLVGYIFISFAWWVLLLIRINDEAFQEKRDLLQLSYSKESMQPFDQSPQIKAIDSERRRKVYMITGEGSVFLGILIVMTIMMNRSLRREVKLQQVQKNFLLSITHELRSPIASSKVAMQTLLKHSDLPKDKIETLLHNSISDMDRLHTLVENLLLAAKIEDHSFRIGRDACDLSEIVHQVVEKVKATSEVRRNFELAITNDVMVIGDRSGLTSVITNLVENAVKYSVEGSRISISLNDENDKVIFRIADDGLGIPDDEKKKIFQKFYRVGQEETRKTKGTGLGLYIVEKILALHRGTVSVKDNEPRGSVFEVVLPKMA